MHSNSHYSIKPIMDQVGNVVAGGYAPPQLVQNEQAGRTGNETSPVKQLADHVRTGQKRPLLALYGSATHGPDVPAENGVDLADYQIKRCNRARSAASAKRRRLTVI